MNEVKSSPNRRRKRRTAGVPAKPSLPWRKIRNILPPIEPLSTDEIESIHQASLRVLASQLILGTGIYTEDFGFYKRSLIPIALSASLSRSLTIDEQKALGGQKDWGLTPVGMPGVTMRYTQGHRILIRQQVEYGPGCRRSGAYHKRLRLVHQDRFRARFPMLPEVTMEHTWTGFVCASQNQGHGFGKVSKNVYSAICQNGIGVSKGTISGLLAADLACGRDNPLIPDLQSLGTPNQLPPQPFLDVGIRANFAWRNWTGRAEK